MKTKTNQIENKEVANEVKKNTSSINTFRGAAKKEFYSINQALKIVLSVWITEEGKKFAKKYNLKKSDITLSNVIENWHSIKIDNKLAYICYIGAERTRTEKIKTKFTTNDIILSMVKMSKAK